MNTPKYLKFYRDGASSVVTGPLPTYISVDEGAIYQLIGHHKYVEEPGEVILPKPGEKVRGRSHREVEFVGTIHSTGELVFFDGLATFRRNPDGRYASGEESKHDVILPRAPSKRVLKFVPVATEE